MKIHRDYLKGTQINGQFNCKPEWFELITWKGKAMLLRIWKIHIIIVCNK